MDLGAHRALHLTVEICACSCMHLHVYPPLNEMGSWLSKISLPVVCKTAGHSVSIPPVEHPHSQKGYFPGLTVPTGDTLHR